MHICGARYGGHDHSSHHRLQLAAGTSTLPELGELAVVAGTSSEVSSEYTVAEETCLGTRWQTPSQGTWRLTTARWTGRRGRSIAVIGVMTRKIIIVNML